MRIVITIIFIIFLQTVHAQSDYPDSLLRLLDKASNDSARFSINLKLADYYFDRNRRKTFEYNEEALQIARENNKMLDVALCLDTKGYYLNKEDRYGEAFNCYIEGFKYAENSQSQKQTWLKPPEADPFQYRMQVLAGLHHDLGHVFWSTGNFMEAIHQFRLCLPYLDKALPISHNSAFMNIGAVYLDLNKLDSALYYERKALATNHLTYRSTMLKYIGDIYFRQGNNDSARYYYHKGLKLAIKQNKVSGLAIGYMGLAQYHLVTKNPDSSLMYASDFLNAFHALHGNPIKDINMSIAYELMFRAYQLKRQKDSTLKYMNLAFYTRDSISQKKIRSLTDFQNLTFKEQLRLEELEKEKIDTQNKIRIYALLSGLLLFLLIALVLYRQSRQKYKANRILQDAYSKLQATQTQLIHAEKMASLGELTAGIAHEIQNPLNFVNNFSEINSELIDELMEEIKNENLDEIGELATDIKENEERINQHGKRADAIVKGMLQHSRSSTGQKESTDINALCDEYLRLSYHGLRAKDKSFNATMKVDFDESIGKINIISQDIGRVILNLINNAFFAVDDKKKSGIDNYEPTVSVSTKKKNDKVEICVTDNGDGIPKNILDKIFQPFFTTKASGEGTGLGLSLSYDIITKGHGGNLKVETNEGEGSVFIIKLPI